jgi:DNA polymerase III delta prime subunit
MRERQLAEIAKMPPSEQAAAKAEIDEREKFFAAIRDLPEDQRREKMRELFNNPDMQDRMADRRMLSNERKSPEQRLEKYQRYVARKQQAANSKSQ